MTVKDCYEDAVRNEFTDLYALIMFLIFEKGVLSFDDSVDKLHFYLQDRFKVSMNKHIKQYKKKCNIQYHPSIFEIAIERKGYSTIYILAYNEQQATSYALSLLFKPTEIRCCDNDLLMTKYNSKNEEVNLTVMQLRDQQSKIPTFLGGF